MRARSNGGVAWSYAAEKEVKLAQWEFVLSNLVAHVTDTTYAVGDPAFGRAVLYLLWWFGFALVERKTEPQTQWGYHAAAGLKAFEGGTA